MLVEPLRVEAEEEERVQMNLLARPGATLSDIKTVVGLFGAWAIVAGLLQLVTGLRRWKSFGAQWTMVLSGAQSALAGGFFIKQSIAATVHGIADVAPYAGFGAFYFLVSALWLTVRHNR